jgi:hypothetical protein
MVTGKNRPEEAAERVVYCEKWAASSPVVIITAHGMIRTNCCKVFTKTTRATCRDLEMVNQSLGIITDGMPSALPAISKFSLITICDTHKVTIKSSNRKRSLAIHRYIATDKLVVVSFSKAIESKL